MKKLTLNQAEFEKQVKRLMKAQRQAEKEGIKFIKSPIPEQPKRITKQYIEKLKTIKPLQVKEMGYTVNDTGELEPYKAPKTKQPDISTGGSRRHPKTTNEIMRDNLRRLRRQHGGGRPKGEPKEKVYKTKEELKQIRSEASKKAWDTRKKQGWKMSEKERQRRSEATKEYWKQKKESGWQSKAKQRIKKTEEELKKIRSEASKKAWATRKQREASDPEYKKKMDAVRRANLEKAREKHRQQKEIVTDEQWDRLKQKHEYEKRKREKEQEEVPEIETPETEEVPEIETPDLDEYTDEKSPWETDEENVTDIFDRYLASVLSILDVGANKRSCQYVKDIIEYGISKYGRRWFVDTLSKGELVYTHYNKRITATREDNFDIVENAQYVAYGSVEDTIVDGGCYLINFFVQDMWDEDINFDIYKFYDYAKADLDERFGRGGFTIA